jgi:hypothetical protein
MEFVDDDRSQAREHHRRVRIRQQESQRLRRRQQDVWRRLALALAPVGRRIAGSALDPHRQADLLDRRLQVARDVGGERLERRHVERVNAAPAAAVRQLNEARQEARQRLAAAGRRDQEAGLAACRRVQNLELIAVRPPAPALEPGGKAWRQSARGGRIRPLGESIKHGDQARFLRVDDLSRM